MGKVVIPGFRKIETSGGGGSATTSYEQLTDKPTINAVPITGHMHTTDLHLTSATLEGETGVPADSKLIGDKLEEHSTSLTALSEQLGSHTVKSDVPENAVFTDTIYDDAELKESISQQSTEMMDIKMLGWSVPRECPIQNEVNGNQFVQKVDRVDLGSLDYAYEDSHKRFIAKFFNSPKIPSDNREIFKGWAFNLYTIIDFSTLYTDLTVDKLIAVSEVGTLSVRNLAYTDTTAFKSATQGQYLYYELATYNTITIDGNEAIASLLKRIETLESLVSKTDITVTE